MRLLMIRFCSFAAPTARAKGPPAPRRKAGLPTPGLRDVKAIAAPGFHSLALRADGTVGAWGDNTYAQASVAVGLANITDVAGGGRHSLALKSDVTVVASIGGRHCGRIRPQSGA